MISQNVLFNHTKDKYENAIDLQKHLLNLFVFFSFFRQNYLVNYTCINIRINVHRKLYFIKHLDLQQGCKVNQIKIKCKETLYVPSLFIETHEITENLLD